MPMRPRIRPAVGAFEVTGLRHFPDHEQRTLIEIPWLERGEVDGSRFGRFRGLLCATERMVEMASK